MSLGANAPYVAWVLRIVGSSSMTSASGSPTDTPRTALYTLKSALSKVLIQIPEEGAAYSGIMGC